MRYLKSYNESYNELDNVGGIVDAVKLNLEDCKVFHADIGNYQHNTSRIWIEAIIDFSDNEEVMQMFNNMCDKARAEALVSGQFGHIEPGTWISTEKLWDYGFGNTNKGILYSKLINVIKGVMDKIVRKYDWKSCQIKPYEGMSVRNVEFEHEVISTIDCNDGLKFCVKIALNP